eukprot:TRINITY_DN8184_c0_g1_i1.p1 TRINITY_DN8184_c0_g1~~TRINITY_DN8184_c0_g1_i1.p1  ORF type:complete len:386 (+),score=94.20 TRINITY_DN8184_c0_g1_i1:50-1159(+)
MLALRVAARQVCEAGVVLCAGAGVGPAMQVRSKVTKAADKKTVAKKIVKVAAKARAIAKMALLRAAVAKKARRAALRQKKKFSGDCQRSTCATEHRTTSLKKTPFEGGQCGSGNSITAARRLVLKNANTADQKLHKQKATVAVAKKAVVTANVTARKKADTHKQKAAMAVATTTNVTAHKQKATVAVAKKAVVTANATARKQKKADTHKQKAAVAVATATNKKADTHTHAVAVATTTKKKADTHKQKATATVAVAKTAVVTANVSARKQRKAAKRAKTATWRLLVRNAIAAEAAEAAALKLRVQKAAKKARDDVCFHTAVLQSRNLNRHALRVSAWGRSNIRLNGVAVGYPEWRNIVRHQPGAGHWIRL